MQIIDFFMRQSSFLEKFVTIIAWVGLIGGVLFGSLVSKGILESKQEMCVPQAFVCFAGAVFVSVAGFAVLMLLVDISKRMHDVEDRLDAESSKHKN